MSSNYGFDLKTLDVFINIVETQNMTIAGQRLGMSQSTISQTLSHLEESLHVQLLDRSVRPLVLTTAGRYFYDRALNLLNEAKQTSLEMRKADYTRLRHVKVALVDSVVTAVGHLLIQSIRKRTQSWSMVTGHSHLHSEMLLSHQADIIISDDPVDDYSGLARQRILREPFVIIVPKDYSGGTSLPELFKQLDMVRYDITSLIGQKIERYLRRNQVKSPPLRLQLDNSHALISAVASGVGCAITTPLCLFQTGLKENQVRLLPLADPFYRELTLVSHENELGDLPTIIAQDCQTILNDNFVAEIRDHHQWLLPGIRVN
ncbi:MAG: LysR family transcriptional regulator [Arenicella sp.]|nr:LysR family transcriptional regulator [Arenicella sp.]